MFFLLDNVCSIQIYSEMGRKCGAQPKFSDTEDKKLKDMVSRLGTNNWSIISKQFKDKTPKQCRDRWRNYVDPELRHDMWSVEEDEMLIEKFKQIGSKWTVMMKYFNHRSSNDIRYRWMKLSRGTKGSSQTVSSNEVHDNNAKWTDDFSDKESSSEAAEVIKEIKVPNPPYLSLIPRNPERQPFNFGCTPDSILLSF